MTNILKHVKVSGKADSVDTTLVNPSDWNEGHTLSGGNSGALVVRDTSDGTYGQSLINSVASGQVLTSAGAGSLPAWSATPSLTSVTLASGTVGAPSSTFTGDLTTGRYSVGSGNVGEATSGVLRFDWNATRLNTTLPIYFPNGSVAAPSLTFTSATNTGLYRDAATGEPAITAAGTISVGFAQNLVILGSTGALNWTPSTPFVNGDTELTRISAGVVGSLTTKAQFPSVLATSATSGLGYGAGAGGTVTQATSKSTGVTLNTVTGAITMNGAALGATTSVAFTLTNSAIAATDVVVVNLKSGNTANSYFVSVDAVAAGSCSISLRNYSAGSLSEAVVLTFAVIKGVTA